MEWNGMEWNGWNGYDFVMAREATGWKLVKTVADLGGMIALRRISSPHAETPGQKTDPLPLSPGSLIIKGCFRVTAALLPPQVMALARGGR